MTREKKDVMSLTYTREEGKERSQEIIFPILIVYIERMNLG